MVKIFGALACVMILSAACVPAAENPGSARATLDSCGTTRDIGEPERLENRDLPGGVEVRGEMEIVDATDRIPARVGVSFGCHFTVHGLRPGEEVTLRKVVSHPPMRLPDGTASRGYEKTLGPTRVRSDGTVAATQGYRLEEPFELVPGEWVMEIWMRDQKLASKTFHLLKSGDGSSN